MHPFECISKACKNLIKYKGLQILLESMQGEIEDVSSYSLGNNCSIALPPKMNYNVTIRLHHNFSIDLVFQAEDFDINKKWGIEKYLKLAGLTDDDKNIARFMYFFWELSKYIKTPKADSGPMETFIFCRTKIIRQTL